MRCVNHVGGQDVPCEVVSWRASGDSKEISRELSDLLFLGFNLEFSSPNLFKFAKEFICVGGVFVHSLLFGVDLAKSDFSRARAWCYICEFTFV